MGERRVLEQPRKSYGPIAKIFLGVIGAAFGLFAFIALLDGQYFDVVGLGLLAVACFYGLLSGREIRFDDYEPRRLEPCPCCENPVLDVGWASQSCLICEWEVDDNVDNLVSDLERARANFRHWGLSYSIDDGSRWDAREVTAEEKMAKADMIKVLTELQASKDRRTALKLWAEFERLEADLHRYKTRQAEHDT